MQTYFQVRLFAIGLCTLGPITPASAEFLQGSAACPGAIERVEFDPSTPGQVLEVRIPSGGTATCNSLPALFPVPRTPNEVGQVVTQIVGDGTGITFVNNVAGIEGQTPVFEAVLTGSGHMVTNNGDLFLLLQGDNAEVTNQAGFLTGLIEGDDPRLENEGVILGMTIEGDRAIVVNNGGIGEGFPDPVPAARGILVVGIDADIRNNGMGTIGVQGDGAVAAGAAGNRSTIVNQGSIGASGAEAIGAGVLGNGTADDRARIETSGSIQVSGTESIAAIVEGDFAEIGNSGDATASGRESRSLVIEGDSGLLNNDGTTVARGDLAVALLLDGANGRLSNGGNVTAGGEVAFGMAAAGTGNRVNNLASVDVTGLDATAVGGLGDNVHLTNESGATITADGEGAYGMALGLREVPDEVPSFALTPQLLEPSRGTITNSGEINVGGDGSAAIHGFVRDTTVVNRNELSAQGENARGIDLHLGGETDQTSTVTNSGNVRAFNGTGVAGIYVDRQEGAGDVTLEVTNNGLVFAQGQDARGIAGSGADTSLANNRLVDVSGSNSAGVSVAGGTVEARNGDDGNPLVDAEIRASGSGAIGMSVAAASAGVSNQGGIAVSGGSNTGMVVEATSGGGFLVENSGTINAAGTGMKVVSSAGSAAEFSSRAGPSACVGASSAGFLNCGTINADGDGAIGMQGTSIRDFVVENSDTINVNGPNAAGLVLDGAAGSPSAGNIVLSLNRIDAEGTSSRGVVIDGVSNILAHGIGAHVIPLDPDTVQVISIEIDRTTSREGDVPAPAAVIEADGIGSIGVDVAGTGNVVSLAVTSVQVDQETFIDVPAEIRALGNDGSVGVNIDGNLNRLLNAGRITSDGIAIKVNGNDNVVTSTGFVDSATGIAVDVNGFGNTVEMLGADPIGEIRVGHFGNRPENSTTSIVNATELSGGIEVDGVFQGVDVVIENRETGQIGGVDRAIQVASSDNANVMNRGDIAAISGSATADVTVIDVRAKNSATVYNTGNIEGVGESSAANSTASRTTVVSVVADQRAEFRNDGSITTQVLGDGVRGGTAVVLVGAEAAYFGTGDIISNISETFSTAPLSVVSNRSEGAATENDLHVENSGTLRGWNSSSVSARTSTTGLIENTGAIISEGDRLFGQGALSVTSDRATANMRIHNRSSGVIATVGTDFQFAMHLQGTGSFDIVNNGRIVTAGSFTFGQAISTFSGSGSTAGDVSVINNGEILTSPSAAAINLAGGNDLVRNVGTIQGQVWLGNGNDTFEAAGGRDGQPTLVLAGDSSDRLVADSATATALTGDLYREFERFDKIGDGLTAFDGTLRLQGQDSLAQVLAGDLIFDDAELIASRTVVAEGALVRGNGIISGVGVGEGRFGADIDVLGGILPGTSAGEMQLFGDVTLRGFFGLEIGELASDSIFIDGNLLIDDGTLILALIDDFIPDFNSIFDLITISGAVTGLDTLSIVNPVESRFEFGLAPFDGGSRLFVSAIDTAAVPEPSTLALLGSGVVLLFLASANRRRVA